MDVMGTGHPACPTRSGETAQVQRIFTGLLAVFEGLSMKAERMCTVTVAGERLGPAGIKPPL